MHVAKNQAIILAAGASRRFNTGRSKLIEKICGQEMILYPVRLMERAGIPTILVLGAYKESVESVIKKHGVTVDCIEQSEQKGTGHALLMSKALWHGENILVMNGDMPLLTDEIVDRLLQTHETSGALASFVVAHNIDPLLNGYGRVVQTGNQLEIIEDKDYKARGLLLDQCCVNAGVYIFKRSFLEAEIDMLTADNAAREFYITDLIRAASLQGVVEQVQAPFDVIRGVNTLKELWAVEQIKRSELISHWMDRGIRFHMAQTVHIDVDVTIGAGTYIGCGVHLSAGTSIGSNCSVRCYSVLSGATIGDNVCVQQHSVITNSVLESGVQVGPFAHIESNSTVGSETIIGNFVQVKRSKIGKKVRAKHLAFLGDTQMADEVNIGGGTITCNFDGKDKHTTVIGKKVCVGSNNSLVAPVKLGDESLTAAGSVITYDVPPFALGIGRARQVNKEGYVLKKRHAHANDASSVEDSEPSFSAARKAPEEPEIQR